MLGILGVIEDLIDIIDIRAFHEGDTWPPLPEVGGNLDHLVFRLRVGPAEMIPGANLPDEKALVPVGLAVDRGAEEAVSFLKDDREDLGDVLLPEAAVEIDRIINYKVATSKEIRTVHNSSFQPLELSNNSISYFIYWDQGI